MNMLTKLLDKAVKQNCIVYDDQAKPFEFTPRLLSIMAHLASMNGFAIRKWVVSAPVIIHGFPYRVDPSLTQRYLDLGASLPSRGKFEVVLAIGLNNEVLLGAF